MSVEEKMFSKTDVMYYLQRPLNTGFLPLCFLLPLLERAMKNLPVWAIWIICVGACVAFWVVAGFVLYGLFK
jgi:hypothetical protein